MTASSGGFFSVFFSLSKKLKTLSLAMLFAAGTCAAQSAPPTDSPDSPAAAPAVPAPQQATLTIAADSTLVMALTHPVDSRNTHRGDEIFAQTTSPVIVSNQVAIPAGTFVQAKVDKLTRRGSRGELVMQSVSIVFPNGYVATVKGPLKMESDEGTAWNNPSTAEKTGIIVAPIAGLGIGAAIGAAQHTTNSSTLGGTTLTASSPKGLAIGSLVGLAAGGAVSLVLLARSHHFYIEQGSPVGLTLPQPVTLAVAQIGNGADAATSATAAPTPLPPTPMPASAMHGTCYIPGRPGTPGAYIPSGDSTPDTYVPGTPPTPPIPYPCP
ncbi:MAG TPA: hypothetical protein VHV29_01400 [Terriglobales bacterium]|jgi:hypothetical protein|nr:hypothetical protein [Terriglobales bacterium]